MGEGAEGTQDTCGCPVSFLLSMFRRPFRNELAFPDIKTRAFITRPAPLKLLLLPLTTGGPAR